MRIVRLVTLFEVEYWAHSQSLVFSSGNDWPSTSVMEMNKYAGIPLSKIVIGKPINAGAANNG
jgi:hypothetical protein